MASSIAHIPFVDFLTAYPHPAFIVQGRHRSDRVAPDLNTVLGNPSFRSLLLGPDADTAELGRSFLRALQTVEAVERFAAWLSIGLNDSQRQIDTLEVTLRLSWAVIDAEAVVLELSQTILEDFTVCTSVPRSSLPKSMPIQTAISSASPVVTQRRAGRTMRLPDFPPPPMLLHSNTTSLPSDMFSMIMRAPTLDTQSSHSPERRLETSSSVQDQGRTGVMRDMIENFDWDDTPLGPRREWSSVSRTAVDYMLSHPFPVSLWWTEELVLLYNDAYKDMIAHKHPSSFAQHGSLSWAEIWDSIGPRVDNVFAGEAVAERDDLLFIERMTEAKLPEETYHSWFWVPVTEDGVVKGFLNGTFETTTKVITERRMNFLRDFSTQAAQSRTALEFSKTLLLALESFRIDCPFAALYSASIAESGSTSPTNIPRTSYLRKTFHDSPMTIKLTCAGTVGVPMPHPSVPQTVDFVIDPLRINPSPRPRPQTASPVPSFSSQDSTVTTVPHEEAHSSTPSNPSARALTAISFASLGGSNSRGSSVRSVNSSTRSIRRIQESAIFWPFAEAFATRLPVHVANLPDYVVEGFELRGWGEHAREAIVIPICVEDADVPGAMLVLGLNSRRPYDADYANWIDLFRLTMNAMLTAVKGREADLIRAEHLAELDSAKTAFFSNASHELRTPLQLIQGPLQDAVASLPDSKARDGLKMAARNVTRLSRLVDSLMDFSKLAANRLEGRFRPVQLGEVTADLASLFRSVIERTGIEYIVDCDTTDRKQTYIDPDFWEKILFNLIGNAFKYTLRGYIHVIVRYDSDRAYFHVKDTGVGIPQSDIDKIFDRFHRVQAIARCHEGTGIGLSLTRELVKLHGGTLTVVSATAQDSPTDHGSCFTVTLPLGRDHLPAAHIVQNVADVPQNRLYARGIVDEATHWSSRHPDERTPSDTSDSGGSSDSGGRMDPSTLFFVKSDIILLVDDNGDMRRYIKSLFIPFCRVVEASNGQEALSLLDEIKPNLILSDVMMPVLDGYALISHVRRRPETRLTPIILVTAKESEEARVEGLLSGADDYMSKPFTGKELIARVHLQMQLGKRRIELEGKFLERTREIQLLSDLSPVGICRADANRRMLYMNQRCYEISGLETSAPDEQLGLGGLIGNICFLDSNELLIPPMTSSVQEEDQQVARDLWESAFATQKSASIETRFKNGIYAKWSVQPVHSPEGTFSGIISTITDVSDQRHFEETRLQHAQEREALARKRAEEAEERRKEADERRRGQELLIDVTSHELRQPVSAILNCSSLVRSNLARHRKELGRACMSNAPFRPTKELLRAMDDDLDALDAIYQCGLAQERIANDVLSLSRIQLQILSIQPVEFELIPEIQRIVSIFRNELKMKRINLNTTFDDSLRGLGVNRVRSDKSRFGQVITNLLSNAIKFTDTSNDKRDISITVEVSRRAPGPDEPCVPPREPLGITSEDDRPIDGHTSTNIFIFVSVRDSGPGLNPDDLALLFKRFQQGSNSHNVFGGSGLGLFVSRKLCDLMGGRIDVDSTFGEGATFRFFVEATTASTSMDHNDVHPGYETETSGNLFANMEEVKVTIPLHILITEDNLINQTVLNRQLLKVGYTTSLASNGMQAIKKIRSLAKSDGLRKTFDAILMDCEMPVMDGLTAVREIRKMEQTKELPVRSRIYALTGNARAGQIESALEAGMDEVIIKPYRLDELISKIQSSIVEEDAASYRSVAMEVDTD
ncbi:hypothetical protein ACEPAI_5427 [Sanghuangporus weigelae]